MFLVNSRLGLFTAACSRRLPFSRSYGVILQSSLTMVLPLVLQFSCRLPVSVCGTGTFRLFSSFSRQREFIPFATSFHSTSSPGLIGKCTSLLTGFTICARLSITAPGLSFCVTASFKRLGWYRNIYLLSIRYAFRPLLSPRLTPGGRTFPGKPQTFDDRVSHSILATYAGILSCIKSTAASATASALIHCSSTDARTHIPKLRCTVLAPIIFGAPPLDQ